MLVFVIVRVAPGGPVEQALANMLGSEQTQRSRAESGASLTPGQVLETEEKYDRHKGIMRSYFEWLGILPRDMEISSQAFPDDEREMEMAVPGTVHRVVVTHDGKTAKMEAISSDTGEQADLKDWRVRLLDPAYQAKRWERYVEGVDLEELPEYRAAIFRPRHDGLLQGSLGQSTKYQDSVWSMILQRIPVSLFYGGLAMVLIYAVCLPLGMIKAIKHRTWLDNMSSFLVFVGYAVPGYALGSLLVVFVAAKLRWFALGGFVGDGFEQLSFWGKVQDLAYHGTLPLICYVIGSFAMMTMLMKNNLMDHLAADYVRTAIAKGNGFRAAVLRHALRNSMIPIATTIGGNLTLIVSGSILIERVFDINGFGLLSFNAVLESDQPVIMGVLFVSATLMLLGNVVSDLCVALVDPRVSYQ